MSEKKIPDNFYLAHMTTAYKEHCELLYTIVKKVDETDKPKSCTFSEIAANGLILTNCKWFGSATTIRDLYYSVKKEFRDE